MSTRTIVAGFAAVLVTAGLSCTRAEPVEATAAVEAKPQGHAGHEPGAEAEEPSDLDRPQDELFSATCEHARRTFECDECRYEVGVVRVAAALLEGGLVTTVGAERRAVAVPIRLTGEVRFDERRVGHVSSQVDGVIRKVHVALGDPVTAGQALLELESVAIGDVQAVNDEARAMLELARRSFERVSALRQEGISSEREFLQAKQELGARSA